jgi:dihydrofolate synthase/folylpolyglutamate synthase
VTVIAFLYFDEREVELAVLEVGLGGRLDATNICEPLVAAITLVGLDHQQYLGETLPEIAAEKAGIIKPGVPVVVAPQEPAAVAVIARRCAQADAPLIAVEEYAPAVVSNCRAGKAAGPVECDDLSSLSLPFSEGTLLGANRSGDLSPHSTALVPAGRYRFRYRTATAAYDVQLSLRGRHQVTNAQTAIHIAAQLQRRGLDLPPASIAEGLGRVAWPGRLELVAGEPPLLLDGAHNPAGARSLRAFLDEHCPAPVTLIFGIMLDKAIAEIAAILFPAATTVIVTAVANERAAAPALIASLAPSLGYQLICADNVAQALSAARRLTPPGGLICACGSLYLIGEIKLAVGGGR